MNRDRIKSQGTDPLNGNDCYAVLGIVFDWIEEKENEAYAFDRPEGYVEELLDLLRNAGYCGCSTPYGCIACKGRGGPDPKGTHR